MTKRVAILGVLLFAGLASAAPTILGPAVKLDNVALVSFPTAASGNEGALIYDLTNKKMRMSDGTSWLKLLELDSLDRGSMLSLTLSAASDADALTLTRGAYIKFHTSKGIRYDPSQDWLRVAMTVLFDEVRVASNAVIRNPESVGVSRLQIDSYANGADVTSANNPAIMLRSQASTTGSFTALDADDLIVCAANQAGTCVWGASNSGALKTGSQTLPTCASGFEGLTVRDGSAGGATGNPTRLCMCRSAGASDYTWVNTVTGTVGTNTTCSN